MEYIKIDFPCCIYCGEPSEQWEHVFPNSESWRLESGYISWLMPSCKECNYIASVEVFRTVGERAIYVREKLRIRYIDRLGSPWIKRRLEWHIEALDDIGTIVRVTSNRRIIRNLRDKPEKLMTRKNKKGPRNCESCYQPFLPAQRWRRFCSKSCKLDWAAEHQSDAMTYELSYL